MVETIGDLEHEDRRLAGPLGIHWYPTPDRTADWTTYWRAHMGANKTWKKDEVNQIRLSRAAQIAVDRRRA